MILLRSMGVSSCYYFYGSSGRWYYLKESFEKVSTTSFVLDCCYYDYYYEDLGSDSNYVKHSEPEGWLY